MFGALECWPGRYSQKGERPIREWPTQGHENWSTPVTACLHRTAHQMKFINWCSGDQHIKSTLNLDPIICLSDVGNTTQTTGPILQRSMQLSIFSIPGEILCDLSDNWVRNLWSVNSDEITTLLIMMHPVLMCDCGVWSALTRIIFQLRYRTRDTSVIPNHAAYFGLK